MSTLDMRITEKVEAYLLQLKKLGVDVMLLSVHPGCFEAVVFNHQHLLEVLRTRYKPAFYLVEQTTVYDKAKYGVLLYRSKFHNTALYKTSVQIEYSTESDNAFLQVQTVLPERRSYYSQSILG